MSRAIFHALLAARWRGDEATRQRMALDLDLNVCQRMRRCQGFTLIELMISLLVLVILLAIGIPSFRDLAIQDRITSQTNEMLVGLGSPGFDVDRKIFYSQSLGAYFAIHVDGKISMSEIRITA